MDNKSPCAYSRHDECALCACAHFADDGKYINYDDAVDGTDVLRVAAIHSHHTGGGAGEGESANRRSGADTRTLPYQISRDTGRRCSPICGQGILLAVEVGC